MTQKTTHSMSFPESLKKSKNCLSNLSCHQCIPSSVGCEPPRKPEMRYILGWRFGCAHDEDSSFVQLIRSFPCSRPQEDEKEDE